MTEVPVGTSEAELARARNDADYAAVMTFTAKDAEDTLAQAGEFVETVAKMLGRG